MTTRAKHTWRDGKRTLGYRPSQFEGYPWFCNACERTFPSLHAARDHRCDQSTNSRVPASAPPPADAAVEPEAAGCPPRPSGNSYQSVHE